MLFWRTNCATLCGLWWNKSHICMQIEELKDQMSLSYESRMFGWSISGISVDRKYKTATKPTLFSPFMTIVPCRMPFTGGVCPAIQNMHSSCLRREEKKVLRDYLIFIILGRCWRFGAALIGCRARARGKKASVFMSCDYVNLPTPPRSIERYDCDVGLVVQHPFRNVQFVSEAEN